jgi:hypothetical protein
MKKIELTLICMLLAFCLDVASGQSDLLFYDPTTGQGEFYATDNSGNIALLQKHDGWRRTWSMIVPGAFNGDDYTDLLFYDPSTGQGEFYATDGHGNIALLKTNDGWRRTWSIIVPGYFSGTFAESYDGLLFYDPTTGQGEFYTTDGIGGIKLLKKHDGWRRTWSIIVPGNFDNDAHTDLLFYDRSTGQGEFYVTDGSGNIAFLKKHDGWRSTWSRIVLGNF